jgi:hypothetical protein
MAEKINTVWLPQVLFESALIVVSILVALGLDEWRENRQDADTVRLALTNFSSEIRQNQARVEYAAPVNKGLLAVLQGRYEGSGIESVDEFIIMAESYEPVDLQSAAWETALATGSLAKMEYKLVQALSLTYSLQRHYQAETHSGLGNLTGPQNLSDDSLDLAIYNSVRYLRDTTGMEEELDVIYNEAATVINNSLFGPSDVQE